MQDQSSRVRRMRRIKGAAAAPGAADLVFVIGVLLRNPTREERDLAAVIRSRAARRQEPGPSSRKSSGEEVEHV